MELLRHLEGHQAAEGEAGQEIGAVGLEDANLLEVMSGHLLDPCVARQFAIQALRLQSIDRLLRAQITREIAVAEHPAAIRVHAEERWSGTVGLNGDERGPQWFRTAVAEQRSQLFHGG